MTASSSEQPGADYLARLDAVQVRFEGHAASGAASGLTEPDAPSGERWDWGQVWAHSAEFVPYWAGQVRLIMRAGGTEPVPMGRVKTDSARVAAIEADRTRPPEDLMARLADQIGDLRALIGEMTPEDWGRRGLHSTLGVMTMPDIFEEFLIGHLEGHADQLDGLRARAG